jgi:hypothetical protein
MIAAAVTIAGCTPDKKADLATCERETLRFYSDSTGDDFMVACMDVRGYRFDVTPADCDGKSRMARQAACYIPSGFVAGWVDWLRRPAKQPPAADVKRDRPLEGR